MSLQSYRKICAGLLGAVRIELEPFGRHIYQINKIASEERKDDRAIVDTDHKTHVPILLKLFLADRPIRRVELVGVVVSKSLHSKRNGNGSKLMFTLDDMTGTVDCIQFFDSFGSSSAEHDSEEEELNSNGMRGSSSKLGVSDVDHIPLRPKLVINRAEPSLKLGASICVKGELFRFMG
jgi:hypothetical protein